MYGNECMKFFLIGNKSDLESQREVLKEDGQKLADEHGMFFFEVSAKEDTNIEHCFMEATSKVL